MDRVKRRKQRAARSLRYTVFLIFVVVGLFILFHNWQQEKTVESQQMQKKAEVTKTNQPTGKANSKPVDKTNENKEGSKVKVESIEDKVTALIKKMTLEEKVGQLLMVGFYGNEEDKNIKSLIQNQKVGNVILFDRNMNDPSQVAGLTNQLQRDAKRNDLVAPVLIGVDQEGGPVLRMRDKVSPIPSQQELGRYANPNEVYNIAKLNGEEIASMGIQLDFAPVLDLSDNDQRSFGRLPEKSTPFDVQAIKGLNDANVTATLKHFPGNGRVTVDPHLDTSIVKADRNTLDNVDMLPFKQIIQKEQENQFFVMVTHVIYPAYDSKMPASISKPIIQGLLRDQLGYKGIVITDDLDMGAISKYYSFDKLGYAALNAGADILLVCHEYSHQLEMYNGIIHAVDTGLITENRIDESVRRVLTFKLTNLSSSLVSESHAEQVVRSTKHLDILSEFNKKVE
jgi:beta-N-acetylhexosaminidase